MPNHADPLQLVFNKQALQRNLFKELEAATLEMHSKRESLDNMGEVVFQKVLADLRAGHLDSYRAASCYHKLVDCYVKLENVRLGIYDRLHGVANVEILEAEEAAKDTDKSKYIAELSEALLSRAIDRKLSQKKNDVA